MSLNFEQNRYKIVLLIGGRGSGKTYRGSQQVLAWIKKTNVNLSLCFISQTIIAVENVMFYGNSGLINFLNKEKNITFKFYHRKNYFEIMHRDLIHKIYYFNFINQNKLRGYEFDYIWIDELVVCAKAVSLLSQLELCLRKGESRIFISTTPGKNPVLNFLIKRKDVKLERLTSYQNKHLSRRFIAYAKSIEQTSWGKQEILGEMTKYHSWIEEDIKIKTPVSSFVQYRLGIDMAVGNGTIGMILIGKSYNNNIFIIDDYSTHQNALIPWYKIVKEISLKFHNLEIIYESNQGGMLIETLLKKEGVSNITSIFSNNSKSQRAYETYIFYKTFDVSFIKPLLKLKNEMIYQTSFDRIDALSNCFYKFLI